MKRLLGAITILVLSISLLAACAGEQKPAAPAAEPKQAVPAAEQKAPAPAAEQKAAPAAVQKAPAPAPEQKAPAPAAQQQPARIAKESVLRIGVPYDLTSLDPVQILNVNDPQMSAAVYEGLVRYKLGTFDIEPQLATKWESTADGLNWRFFLRKGVQFHHNYGELKAQDVVFTFERGRDSRVKGVTTPGILAGIRSVKAEDEYTVSITLSNPDAAFMHKMADFAGFIVSEKAVRERGADFGQKPVGTGPYQFDRWNPGQEVILVKHAKYWGGEPALNRVIYVAVSDATTMYNAFEAGDLDVIIARSPDKVAKYRQNSRMKVESTPGLQTRHFGMNAAFQPFDNIKVRQAVSYAINRDQITQGLWQGTSTPADGFFPPMVQHALSGIWKPVYDPAKAKQLLAEAGLPQGFKTTLDVPNDERFVKPAVILQEQLKAVGIEAAMDLREPGAFFAKLRKGETSLFSMTKGLDPVPDRVITSLFPAKNFPGDNWTKFSDAEVDGWLAKATTTLDESVRDELFKKVQQRVIDQVHYYLIDYETFHIAYWDKVKGFVGDAQRRIRLDNVRVE